MNIYENLAGLITAEMSDRELALIAAAATASASAELLADLHDVRDRQRGAVPSRTLTDDQLLVRSVMDLGVAELITHASTDTEIAAYVVAAEAGAGGPVFGLKEELIRLRDEVATEWRVRVDAAKERLREEERRVFVSAYGGPVSVSVPDPVSSMTVPRIGNVGETAEERRRIDEIKAGLRIEDL